MEYYVVSWQPNDCCDKAPNNGLAVRINDVIVPGSGKYLCMECPNCGVIGEFKRSGWWNLSKPDEIIEDNDHKDKLISSLPDCSYLVRWR